MAKKIFYQIVVLPLGALVLVFGFQNCARVDFQYLPGFVTAETPNNGFSFENPPSISPVNIQPASNGNPIGIPIEKGTFVDSVCGWYKNSISLSDCTPNACLAGWEDRGVSVVDVHKKGEHETGYKRRTCYNPETLETLKLQTGMVLISQAINMAFGKGDGTLPFTPQKCPTGWTDEKGGAQGIHENMIPTSLSDTGWIIIGYQERVCVRPAMTADRGTFIYPKCAWYGVANKGNSNLAACTPSACPTGWTDYGTSNLYVAQILAATTGYVRRICYNPAKLDISSTQVTFEAPSVPGEMLPPAGSPGPALCPAKEGSDGSGLLLSTSSDSIRITDGHVYADDKFTISANQERICIK